MLDKAKLGTRYTCYKCSTKFYDLNRPVPTCPDCGVDQREAPVRDIRSLLGKGGSARRYSDDEEEIEGGDEIGEDEELGIGGIEDDEDDDVNGDIEEDEESFDEGGGEEEE